MNIDEMITVLEAYKKGKKIEAISKKNNDSWEEVSPPAWDFYHYNYRVKTELLEGYINVYDNTCDVCGTYGYFYITKDEADQQAGSTRIKLVYVKEVVD